MERIALIRALQLAKGLRINIYTDSKYAFLALHTHGAIWKERGLLSRHNSPIKYGPELIALLEAVHMPKKVAVIHLRGHHKEMSMESGGNNQVDRAARQATRSLEDLELLFKRQERLHSSFSFSFPPSILTIPSYHGHNIMPNFKVEQLARYVEFCLHRAHSVRLGGSPHYRTQIGVPCTPVSQI